MPAADIREMFVRFAELNPKPATELEYRTPFELLVAVIL
jgi:endonuclease-3